MEEWEEHVTELEVNYDAENDKPLPKKPDLVFRNSVVRRLFAEESDEVKAEIKEYRNNLVADVKDEGLDLDVLGGVEEAE